MYDQAPVRKIVLVIGCISIVAALVPWWSKRVINNPPSTVEQSMFSIGIPTAPWFELVKEKKENPDRTVVYSTWKTYYPVSLSTASGLGGMVLLFVAWRMRPATPGAQDTM